MHALNANSRFQQQKHIINLAQMTLSNTAGALEHPKTTAEVHHPEPMRERREIDTKASKPKHYSPKNLTVNTFCNIFLEGGVCLAGEENEQNRYAYQNDLIAFYDFDQEINVDLAGSKIAINEEIKAGPGVNEKGASAFFNGDNWVTIDHHSGWETNELRISFWIYIIETTHEKSTKMYCPVILKGYDDFQKQTFHRFPGIFISENTRRIRAFVSLANKDKYRDGIWTESIGRVPLQRWTHVSFGFDKQKLEISINGVLDSIQTLDGREVQGNSEKLYVGGHPSYSMGCKLVYYMDNLKVHNKLASQFALEAETHSALGTISPNQIMLGCLNCDFRDAKNSCIPNYHLCTNAEMVSGVYQAIRILGWVFSLLPRILLQQSL
jgi:hypothetical protein